LLITVNVSVRYICASISHVNNGIHSAVPLEIYSAPYISYMKGVLLYRTTLLQHQTERMAFTTKDHHALKQMYTASTLMVVTQ